MVYVELAGACMYMFQHRGLFVKPEFMLMACHNVHTTTLCLNVWVTCLFLLSIRLDPECT